MTKFFMCFERDGQPVGATDFLEKNLNILAHAQAIELEIGSRCGGHGVCGGDRIRLTEADRTRVSPVTELERTHLEADELSKGWRLACQCFPETASDTFQIQLT